ncbi:MAG: hypothetical protein KGI06_00010 [Candidatus Micrarchaeota archaeon]|nr:hypothetical protein [Candidatus Micrarchaeota archaeon]
MKKHHIKARRGTPLNYNSIAPEIKKAYLENAPNEKGKTMKDIAEEFGISIQTVRRHLVSQGITPSRKTRK